MNAFACPWYFKNQYFRGGKLIDTKDQDLNEGQPNSFPAEQGRAIHFFFKNLVEAKIAGKDFEVSELIETAFKAHSINPAAFPAFKEICENGAGNIDEKINIQDVLAVEEHQTVDLGNGWELNVTPDLELNTKDGLAVIDHKSDWYKRSQDELDNDWQTSVYAYFMSRKYQVAKVFVYMHFARYRGFVSSLRAGEQFKTIEAAIKIFCDKIDAAVAENKWPRQVCDSCRYCEERVQCLAANKDGFSSYDTKEFLVMAGAMKRLSESMVEHAKALMTNQEPIVIDGELYGFVVKDSKTMDFENAEKVIEIMEEYRLPWRSIVKIPNKEIEKILKKCNPEAQKRLLALGSYPKRGTFHLP